MKQHRYLKFITAAARLKSAVIVALLVGACLHTASFLTLSEASEAEKPAASSEPTIRFEYGGKSILYSMDENQLNELRRNQSDSENAPNQVLALKQGLRLKSDTEISLEKQIQELSAKLKQTSETADGAASQDPPSGDDQANQLATQLKDAVEKSFNERQRQQLAEIERLTTRLNGLAESVQQREAERAQIISREIDELPGKSSTKTSTNLFTPEELQWITARSMKLLYFHAPDSDRSRKIKPELESLAAEGVPVEFISYAVDNKLAKQFGVTGVPTVVMMVGGGMDGQWTGFLDRERLGCVVSPLRRRKRTTPKPQNQG